jgi:hypothetical protein
VKPLDPFLYLVVAGLLTLVAAISDTDVSIKPTIHTMRMSAWRAGVPEPPCTPGVSTVAEGRYSRRPFSRQGFVTVFTRGAVRAHREEDGLGRRAGACEWSNGR